MVGHQQGDEVRVFDTDCGKIAIQICYDIEFPELGRIATEKGAKIIFTPFCTEDRQGYLRVRYCAQARAVENQVYTVISGTVGNLPQTENMDINMRNPRFSLLQILNSQGTESSANAIRTLKWWSSAMSTWKFSEGSGRTERSGSSKTDAMTSTGFIIKNSRFVCRPLEAGFSC